VASDSLRRAAVDGDTQEGGVTVGQIAGMLRKTQSAQDIVDELVAGCAATLSAAPGLLQPTDAKV
jgi:enoyl-[acyl-carrier protein] reductase II